MKDLIKPIKNNFMLDDDLFAHDVCEKSEVRELEQNYREAIKMLIEVTKDYESNIPAEYTSDVIYLDSLALVEKLTGQKWEALKNMEG